MAQNYQFSTSFNFKNVFLCFIAIFLVFNLLKLQPSAECPPVVRAAARHRIQPTTDAHKGETNNIEMSELDQVLDDCPLDRMCTESQLGSASGVWAPLAGFGRPKYSFGNDYNHTCKHTKARYICPVFDHCSPWSRTGYRWIPSPVVHGECCLPSEIPPDMIPELLRLRFPDWVPKSRKSGQRGIKVLAVGSSFLRQVIESIACRYDDRLSQKRALVDGDPPGYKNYDPPGYKNYGNAFYPNHHISNYDGPCIGYPTNDMKHFFRQEDLVGVDVDKTNGVNHCSDDLAVFEFGGERGDDVPLGNAPLTIVYVFTPLNRTGILNYLEAVGGWTPQDFDVLIANAFSTVKLPGAESHITISRFLVEQGIPQVFYVPPPVHKWMNMAKIANSRNANLFAKGSLTGGFEFQDAKRAQELIRFSDLMKTSGVPAIKARVEELSVGNKDDNVRIAEYGCELGESFPDYKKRFTLAAVVSSNISVVDYGSMTFGRMTCGATNIRYALDKHVCVPGPADEVGRIWMAMMAAPKPGLWR